MTGFAGADRSYFYGGGLPPFTEREITLEFEPGAIVNKAYANVVNQDQLIDANILAGMPYGRERSEPSKPTLKFPMLSLRVKTGEEKQEDSTKDQLLKSLIKQLPEEIREKLATELKKPESEQNPFYAALGKSLTYFATGILTLAKAAETPELYSPAIRLGKQNLAFNEKLLENLLREGTFAYQQAYALLKKLGPNHPYFDRLLKKLKNAKSALKRLKDSKERGEEKEEEFFRFYEEMLSDEELLILRPMLKIAHELMTTKRENLGFEPLLHSLFSYHIGIEKEPSSLSPIGKKTYSFITQFFQLAIASLAEEKDPHLKHLYHFSGTFSTIFATSLALALLTKQTTHSVLGETISEKEKILLQKNEALIHCHALVYFMHMIEETNVMKRIFPHKALYATFIFLFLTLLIHSVKKIEGVKSTLLSTLSEELQTSIKEIESAFSKLSKKPDSLLATLTNCRILLEKEEYEKWYAEWNKLSQNLQEEEIEKFLVEAKIINSLFQGPDEEFSNAITGIVQI